MDVDSPKRATAAQMANRKIARGRTGVRPSQGQKPTNVFKSLAALAPQAAQQQNPFQLPQPQGAPPPPFTPPLPPPFTPPTPALPTLPSPPPVTPLTTETTTNEDTNALGMPPPAPEHFTEAQKREYVTAYRIRSLNRGFKALITSMSDMDDMDVAVRFYTEKREEILAAQGLPFTNTSRKRSLEQSEIQQQTEDSSKKPKMDSVKPTTEAPTSVVSPTSRKRSLDHSELQDEESSKKAKVDLVKPTTEAPTSEISTTEVSPTSRKRSLEHSDEQDDEKIKKAKLGLAKPTEAPTSEAPQVTTSAFRFGTPGAPSTTGGISVFDNPIFASQQAISRDNIFGHLSDSGTDTKKNGSEDTESDEDEEPDTQRSTGANTIFTTTITSPFNWATNGAMSTGHIDTPKAPTSGKSLFDRISKDENGKVMREVPAPTPTKPANGAFAFGQASKIGNPFLTASVTTSPTISRATSPGLTTDTGEESAKEPAEEPEEAEAEAETATKQQQIDLAAGGPGEEDEDVLFEVRGRALKLEVHPQAAGDKPTWENQGVGPLRVLKNRVTKKARAVMRMDPSGRLILNAALLKGVKYEHRPSAVVMGVATATGGLSTWMIRVKRDEDAMKLANLLEENKST